MHEILKDKDPYILFYDSPIIEFFDKQNKFKFKSFIIVDKKLIMKGTLSDGDIRRYILNKKKSPIKVQDAMNKKPFFVYQSKDILKEILHYDISKGPVPILNSKMKIVGVYNGGQRTLASQSFKIKSFTVIAPARISFGGGGSDLGIWFKKNIGLVVNLAIKKYARVSIGIRNDNEFHIHSLNTNEKIVVKNDLHKFKDNIIISCLKKFDNLPGLNISIHCDYGPGTGLGGSSSLVVALVTGLSKILDLSLTEKEIAMLSFEIERNDHKIEGGWQDQIAASYGGLLISQFSPKGFKVIKTNLTTKDEDFLNSTLFIFKAGDERSSSDIHKGIRRVHGRDSFIETMEKVVSIAKEAEDVIVNRQFNEIGKILHKGWLQKRKLYKAISNERIDALYSDLISKGASGGRLLGAGGGGYILVFVPLENQRDFLKKCLDDGLVYERVTIDQYGSRVIGENT